MPIAFVPFSSVTIPKFTFFSLSWSTASSNVRFPLSFAMGIMIPEDLSRLLQVNLKPTDYVVSVIGVDWYFSKVILLQNLQHFCIQYCILFDHENIREGNHVMFYLFQAQVHSILQDLYLLWSVAVLAVVVQVEDGSQVLGSKNYFIFVMTQPIVQDVENKLQSTDERHKEISDGHFVWACAVGLRQYFSQDYNCHSRNDNCKIAWHDLVQEDRQSLQSQRITEKQR